MPKQDGELTAKEKEWLETANKYISSKHLPVLGKVLKVVDEMSLLVGRAIVIGLLLAALTAVGWRMWK